MKKIIDFIDRNPILGYALFFVFWYFVLLAANWEFFDNPKNAILTYVKKIVAMAFAAIGFLWLLLPILKKKKYLIFAVGFIVLMLLTQMISVGLDMYVLDKIFPEQAIRFVEKYGEIPFWKRVLNPVGILLRVPIFYLVPTLVLMLIKYMREQHKLTKLNEQKNVAELNALKNQLNPHFLFNTLNNIYSLALQKSDKAPEVVSGLADMLDYMIYKCNENYVPVSNEVKLLEDYIALEKVRYGKRVNVQFNHSIDQDINVAPLVMLTLFENAFKHGVSQEINEAFIDCQLKANAQGLAFELKNSIPNVEQDSNGECVGLSNVRKQLDLLYNDDYKLSTEIVGNQYVVKLNLKAR